MRPTASSAVYPQRRTHACSQERSERRESSEIQTITQDFQRWEARAAKRGWVMGHVYLIDTDDDEWRRGARDHLRCLSARMRRRPTVCPTARWLRGWMARWLRLRPTTGATAHAIAIATQARRQGACAITDADQARRRVAREHWGSLSTWTAISSRMTRGTDRAGSGRRCADSGGVDERWARAGGFGGRAQGGGRAHAPACSRFAAHRPVGDRAIEVVSIGGQQGVRQG